MKLDILGHHSPLTSLNIPHYLCAVPAGFPSPADDYRDKKLDLNTYLIKHPAATFYCRVSGSSMQAAGIFDGDLLIVDRALTPEHGQVVIACVDGEMTCKFLDVKNQRLVSANAQYPPIAITEDTQVLIEGVVIHSVRTHVCLSRL